MDKDDGNHDMTHLDKDGSLRVDADFSQVNHEENSKVLLLSDDEGLRDYDDESGSESDFDEAIRQRVKAIEIQKKKTKKKEKG